MPELPEVEIITRGLKNKIIGREFKNIEVRAAKLFKGNVKDILGTKIKYIQRHAKMIEIGLSGDKALLIHLKMTGQLVYRSKGGEVRGGHPDKNYLGPLPNRFTHIIFHFKDGGVLYFNDLRKFGYVKIFDQKNLSGTKELKDLGPDPFTKELNEEYLMRVISKRSRIKVKQILMDQTVIAGIGNIYADESLFCARISPLRPAGQVKKTQLTKLISCIRKVLKKALEYGGSSENTFVNVEGKQGKMQDHFQIYRKTGLHCPVCGGKIMRTVVSGRGTHYCPVCQK